MSLKRTGIASALMILTLVCLSYLSHGENICPNKPFSSFPKRIGDWLGEERHFDKEVYDVLGVDDSLLRTYSYDGHQIELYIGFYRSQREGDIIHSPKNCMPGSGWHFAREGKLSIDPGGTSEKKSILVNNILLQKGNERQVMFYWFQGRNRYMTSEYMQKIYLVVDSITKHRTDEAFIRLTIPVMDADDEKTVKYLQDFTRLLLPLLQEYLPS